MLLGRSATDYWELSARVHELEARIGELEAENGNLRGKLIGMPMRRKKVWTEPGLLTGALAMVDSVPVGATLYFEDEIAKLTAFDKMQFKLLKPRPSIIPDGWTIEEGALVVMSPDDKMVGIMSANNVGRYGFISAKRYYGYVIPPYNDMYLRIRRNDHYRISIFTGRIPM